MANHLTETEKQIKTINAVNAITEYLRHTSSYCDLMETAAIGQSKIINLMTEANEASMDDACSFIYNALEVYKLLRPFAEMEGQV